MSNRNAKVSALLKREVSDILHTRLQAQSVSITITGVDVAPDHQNAVVFFSVIESGSMTISKAKGLLDRNAGRIRHELTKRIVLKQMPSLKFAYDKSIAHGTYLTQLMDSLEVGSVESEEAEGEDD